MLSRTYDETLDIIRVEFSSRILDFVPRRMSTEVDARLSYDTEGTDKKALKIVDLYRQKGISKERVFIKIASTYEGIQAAKELEAKHGVHVDLNLLFSQVQAIAAAEVKATLISPFVGRILDWLKKNTHETYTGTSDPGVKSVTSIFNYNKKFGYKTIVLGASFRNTDEIVELVGVDFLTIAPKLLEESYNSEAPVPRKRDSSNASNASALDMEKQEFLDYPAKFHFELNQDQMAVEKLSEGIRNFAKDSDTLVANIVRKF